MSKDPVSRTGAPQPRGAAALSRRRFLGAAALAIGGAGAAALAGSGPAAAQSSKAQADYQDSPRGGQRCADCRFFRAPNRCQIVAGEVSPNGWCRFFAATAPGGY